jgi:serine/threonine protein kinase
MGLVFLGHSPEEPDLKIVIKVLLPQFAQDKGMNERFMNEAKILSKVYHPNIPKIYKVGEWEHGIYIAMEYFQGISLRSFINQQSFSLEKALEIIVQIGYALYHLHSHGDVHRDLKTENVILTENGEVKVIDFSLSQLIPEDQLEHMLGLAYRAGTNFYMTPEQRDNPRLVTKATDIYALGIISFELILGRSTYGVIQTFLLPQGLRQIIEKAIQIHPDLRYSDVFDYIQAISQYAKKLAAGEEEREVAQAGPVKELLDHIQSVFLPKKAPHSPLIEIGVAYRPGMAINALYLDFFLLKAGELALFVAEPLRTGVQSLFHTFGLRGMVRLEAMEKEVFGASVHELFSKALYNDPMDQKFGASTLLLKPKENKAIFSSCQFAKLWQVVGEEVQEHETNANVALGTHSKARCQEVEIEWGKKETLILYSHPMDLKKREERQKVILSVDRSDKQTMAEKLLEKISHLSPTSHHKGTLLITIGKRL